MKLVDVGQLEFAEFIHADVEYKITRPNRTWQTSFSNRFHANIHASVLRRRSQPAPSQTRKKSWRVFCKFTSGWTHSIFNSFPFISSSSRSALAYIGCFLLLLYGPFYFSYVRTEYTGQTNLNDLKYIHKYIVIISGEECFSKTRRQISWTKVWQSKLTQATDLGFPVINWSLLLSFQLSSTSKYSCQ